MTKQKTIRRILAGLLCLMLAVTFSAGGRALLVGAEEYSQSTPETNSIEGWPQKKPIWGQSCVLIDNDTGAVLCALNKDTQRYPASTTKVLTCLLALENLDLGATVTMTEEGVAGVASDSSNAGTVVGEEFTVEQCLYMLMLKSANDIANQLAVEMGGTIEGFADMMNERAAQIGCTGTHFHNASGMPDEEHYTTAMDMALIFREALKNDKFREIISTLTYTVPPTNKLDDSRTYGNHNALIDPDSEYYYEPCIGGKTGFTNAAQRTLVTAAEMDGRTLICVTMKTPDKSDYYDHQNLYIYGFSNFTPVPLDGGTVILPSDMDTSGLLAMAQAHKAELERQAGAVSAESAAAAPAAVGDTAAGLFTATYEPEGEHYQRANYFYSGLPIGSALIEIPEVEVISEPEISFSLEEDVPAAGTVKKKNSALPVIGILALVAAAALVCAGLWYKKQLDRQREQLRQRQKSRREEMLAERRKAREAQEEAEADEEEAGQEAAAAAPGGFDAREDFDDFDDDTDDDDLDDLDDDDPGEDPGEPDGAFEASGSGEPGGEDRKRTNA